MTETTTPKRTVSREARVAAAMVKITSLLPASREVFDTFTRSQIEKIMAAKKALDRCDVDDRARVLAILKD